jgi:hypothetical protein
MPIPLYRALEKLAADQQILRPKRQLSVGTSEREE